jgi:uncharacterized membrane protein
VSDGRDEFPRGLAGNTEDEQVSPISSRRNMATIEQSIEVAVPVSVAYNQWTQFEEFPSFMEGVEQVRQLDDTHLHWVVSHNGKQYEFDTEVSEQRPDERVAWTTVDGKAHSGVVTFHRLTDDRTRIMVQMEWEPEGMLETLGAALGSDDRRVKADLERFKRMIDARSRESGGWRGEIERGEVVN